MSTSASWAQCDALSPEEGTCEDMASPPAVTPLAHMERGPAQAKTEDVWGLGFKPRRGDRQGGAGEDRNEKDRDGKDGDGEARDGEHRNGEDRDEGDRMRRMEMGRMEMKGA